NDVGPILIRPREASIGSSVSVEDVEPELECWLQEHFHLLAPFRVLGGVVGTCERHRAPTLLPGAGKVHKRLSKELEQVDPIVAQETSVTRNGVPVDCEDV